MAQQLAAADFECAHARPGAQQWNSADSITRTNVHEMHAQKHTTQLVRETGFKGEAALSVADLLIAIVIEFMTTTTTTTKTLDDIAFTFVPRSCSFNKK